MGLVLHALLTLVTMYATARSPWVGMSAAAAIGAGVSLTGGVRYDWLPIVLGGVVMGLMTRAQARPSLAVLGTGLAMGTLVALIALTGDREVLRADLEHMLETQAAALNLPQEGVSIDALTDVVLMAMPAATIISVVGALALAYWMALRVFPRLGVSVPSPEPLALWRGPFLLAWTFAAGLLALVLGRAMDVMSLTAVGLNVSLLHAVAFFVLGVGVIRYRLVAAGLTHRLQVLMLALLLVVGLLLPLPLVVVALGLFDIWFDFRKLDAPVDPEGPVPKLG